jgi:C-terminal processing protease CtpA/Prc
MNDRIVVPTPGRPRYPGRVALLIGPVCMSSYESFIMMMRGDPQCRSFGARTRGSSGGPRSHDLGVGISVLLPSWQDYFPDGTLLEGKGIEPDVPVEFDAKATTGDPVLAAALEWLRN